MQNPHNTAFLGLGGNIGDVAGNMAMAINILGKNPEISITATSSLYRTQPQGVLDQPDFLNAVIQIETSLTPQALLDAVLRAEILLHRVRTQRWGPRTIDIDLLVYGDVAIKSAVLEIPHPRIAERAFVLIPLREIAPKLQINGLTLEELVDATQGQGIRLEIKGDSWVRYRK